MLLAKYDVFLSYSRKDRAVTDLLYEELKGFGLKVFYDRQSISPGDEWKRQLGNGISRSRSVVLCWSKNAKESEFVQFEWAKAEAPRKRVTPWRLDSTSFPSMSQGQAFQDPDPKLVAAELAKDISWRVSTIRTIELLILSTALLLGAFALYRFVTRPPLIDGNFLGTWRGDFVHEDPLTKKKDIANVLRRLVCRAVLLWSNNRARAMAGSW